MKQESREVLHAFNTLLDNKGAIASIREINDSNPAPFVVVLPKFNGDVFGEKVTGAIKDQEVAQLVEISEAVSLDGGYKIWLTVSLWEDSENSARRDYEISFCPIY